MSIFVESICSKPNESTKQDWYKGGLTSTVRLFSTDDSEIMSLRDKIYERWSKTEKELFGIPKITEEHKDNGEIIFYITYQVIATNLHTVYSPTENKYYLKDNNNLLKIEWVL